MQTIFRWRPRPLTLVLGVAAALGACRAEAPAASDSQAAAPAQLEEIRAYIHASWKTLTRSPSDLARAAVDPKSPGKRALIYVAPGEDLDRIAAELAPATGADARVELRVLPSSGAVQPGLLYLPRPYVVPGGRFNEMYGWDSYFILLGLLRDGETARAKDICDDFLYEVARYGKVLNANRTYYLTRSQPPFLSAMILAVYAKTGDKAWLRAAVPALESTYRYWTTGPHLAGDTGLSRYYDSGDGPAPEVVSGERDAQGRTHYDRVREFLRDHPIKNYPLSRYYDAKTDRLTDLFYRGDRSMRESGFDPSDRFGPFNSEILDIAPVCLNTLLYRFETDMAAIEEELGDGGAAQPWRARAELRRSRIEALLWDEKDGLYYDYDFSAGAVRRYPFVTTFYPLWAGLADARRAARVRGNLGLFERAGGLMTSTTRTGKQWDAPFGWAPMQLAAVEGLRRYGYDADADRVSAEFLSLVLKEFLAHHAIVEKYDVVSRGSDLAAGLKFGYSTNEIGFGWTNAVFEELYALLPESGRRRILDLRPPDRQDIISRRGRRI